MLFYQFRDLAEQERIKLEQTIAKFKTGRINCLVSTDVLEEGIDVTQCNLVIRYVSIKIVFKKVKNILYDM